MREINNLATMEGRALVRTIFTEIRFERQLGASTTLAQCWKMCTKERELFRYSHQDVTVLHPLGIARGTSLFLQEIVHRYYYSSINSFVYLGAAVLLVVIGARRFVDNVPNSWVIAGIILEACLLVLMFTVMFFSPPNDDSIVEQEEKDLREKESDLVEEFGELSREFAGNSLHLGELNRRLVELIQQQSAMMEMMRETHERIALLAHPQESMSARVNEVNLSLSELSEKINEFTLIGNQLKQEAVIAQAKEELGKMMVHSKSDTTVSTQKN